MTDFGPNLNNAQTLNTGDFLSSGNGYYAVMQNDGNFVLYVTNDWVPANARWASGTNGKGVFPTHITMQDDGNLVIYDTYMNPTWASHTEYKGTKPHVLTMQTDGNLVVYDGNGNPTWASKTEV